VPRALLDTSVLIALCDPSHTMHEASLAWLDRATDGIATCPIVENGAVRILSQPKYAVTQPISTFEAVLAVRQIRLVDRYEFWSDSVSVLSEDVFDSTLLVGPSQVTDAYLLALAVKNSGVLVTLDTRLMLSAVIGASREYVLTIR
jgi:uncharacterized protein